MLGVEMSEAMDNSEGVIPGVLGQIMAERRDAVVAARAAVSETALEQAAERRVHHSLKARLRGGCGTCVIAEMKKASPSSGVLRPDYDPAAIARAYDRHGAVGLSVLTEPLHFLGDESHLRAVRAVTALPVLRKDFMCDTYQVTEAAAWGADVVLLIAAALPDALMYALYRRALVLGLEVLAEVHTGAELERVLPLDEAIIGVNSRDLKTLKTDLAVAHRLAALIPPARLSIAESGISRREEIVALEAAGYGGFLIGEALVRQDDPGGGLAVLRGGGITSRR
jgi:indole-3-glycerol phosphate synthase